MQLLHKAIWWELRYSDEATTAHPFKPETWHDENGNTRVNHAALDLVAEPGLIASLPEVEAFPPADYARPVFEAFSQPQAVTYPQEVAEAEWRAANDVSDQLHFPAGADAVALAGTQ